MSEPTERQIMDAALRWCREKDRAEDFAYFQRNWQSLPGLRAYVEQEIWAERLITEAGNAIWNA